MRDIRWLAVMALSVFVAGDVSASLSHSRSRSWVCRYWCRTELIFFIIRGALKSPASIPTGGASTAILPVTPFGTGVIGSPVYFYPGTYPPIIYGSIDTPTPCRL